MAVRELAKTPAGRFKRAAKDLARVGITAELITTCCRGCLEAREGTTLLAVELDGTLNDRLGWFQSLDTREPGSFSAHLQWEVPEGRTVGEFLNAVSSCLVPQGFIVEPPSDATKAIKVTVRV